MGWSMDEAASFGFMKWGLVVMTMVNIIYPLVVMLILQSERRRFGPGRRQYRFSGLEQVMYISV